MHSDPRWTIAITEFDFGVTVGAARGSVRYSLNYKNMADVWVNLPKQIAFLERHWYDDAPQPV